VLDNSVAVVSFPEVSDRLRISSRVVIQHYPGLCVKKGEPRSTH